MNFKENIIRFFFALKLSHLQDKRIIKKLTMYTNKNTKFINIFGKLSVILLIVDQLSYDNGKKNLSAKTVSKDLTFYSNLLYCKNIYF